MSTVVQDQEDIQIPVPELLGALLDLEGSDLHLKAGSFQHDAVGVKIIGGVHGVADFRVVMQADAVG